MNEDGETTESRPDASTRRRVLMLGAVSASAVVTIRPALASTAASVLNCDIPVPDPARANQWIAADGSLVSPNTPGAFAPPLRPLKGEEVKAAINHGRTYPGATYEQSKAYTKYIRRLQRGTSGFTCFASLYQ
ncbi:MAG: hypothetical protein AB7G25_10180 [Sphingomonadaceae bacterium]